MLLSSLFMVAAPVSAADPLVWNMELTPSVVNNIITADFSAFDMAVNGDTVYVAGKTTADNCVVYKSVNGGATFTLNNDATTLLGFGVTGFNADFIAVAPDDANIVVVVDATNKAAFVTTIGGGFWSSMALATAVPTLTAVNDLAISKSVFGTRYVAIAGNNGVYYYNLGSATPVWTNAVNGSLFAFNPLAAIPSNFWAVAFSPNFPSDYIMLAVSDNTGAAGTTATTSAMQLHAASFNSYKWNSVIGYFDNYPARIAPIPATLSTGVLTVTKASLALSPDYMGGDDVLRTSFVGLTASDATNGDMGGIYRMSNYISKSLLASVTSINSVDYNGTVLVAGAYATNVAYYCADPLAVTPTVFPSRTYKRPGLDTTAGTYVNDKLVVAWKSEKVVSVKRGDAAAFSVSRDNGLTWNDISLINGAITNITDIAVSADGAKWYIATDDAVNSSVFRYDGGWEKVLNLAGVGPYLLRAAPADITAIYVAQSAGTALYFSADAGQTRWYNRSAPGAITDAVAESKDVVYIGTGATIRKSTNQGFTWGGPLYPFSSAGSVYSLKSVSDGNLVAGSNDGYVGYTTDGGLTFNKLTTAIYTGATTVIVTADKLSTGGMIFAAATGDYKVSRFTIGTDVVWKDLLAPATSGVATGIGLSEGVLYVSNNSTASIVLRQTFPSITPASAVFWGAVANAGLNPDKAPLALKLSTGSTKMWVVNDQTADSIYSYVDTLAGTAPTLVVPANDAIIPLNVQSGVNYNINFTWTRPSLASNYNLWIGLDQNLTQIIGAAVFGTGANTMPTISTVVAYNFTPGTKYWWAVSASAPISGKMSEKRSFTVQPGAAAVPTVGAPPNGSTIKTQSPAFSWNPVSGATQYEFQLSTIPNFGTTVYTAQTADAGTLLPVTIKLEQGKTYFWRVRALLPVKGDWSTVANFVVAEPEAPAPPPVTIQQMPAPVINIPAAPPAQQIVIPPAPAPEQIAPAYIWAIIIIGAVLVIAVIVLIVRTRRSV
jgi:hypothetical protein